MNYLFFSTLFLFSAAISAQEKNANGPMGPDATYKTKTIQQREAAVNAASHKDWWPNKLNLEVLRQHSEKTNPIGKKL
jgi:catalase (peroxidase I)